MTGYEIIGLVMAGVLFLIVFIPMVFEIARLLREDRLDAREAQEKKSKSTADAH